MTVADAGAALGKRARSRITAVVLVSALALVAAVGFGRRIDHPWRLGRLSEPRRVFLAAVFRWMASFCLYKMIRTGACPYFLKCQHVRWWGARSTCKHQAAASTMVRRTRHASWSYKVLINFDDVANTAGAAMRRQRTCVNGESPSLTQSITSMTCHSSRGHATSSLTCPGKTVNPGSK